MSLNPQEKRRIRQIEEQLQASDPELARRMRGKEPDLQIQRVAAWCLFIVGLALTTVPFAEGVAAPLFAIVTLVAATWLFVRVWRVGSRSAPHRDRPHHRRNGSPTP